ncbi:soil-associated protein, TIGR03435 family [Granulicella pectinivorans]|jgi:uncharacterized protein (TIGR03435 family)|uniref:Soil-associated protein, TIGR03435 family n=1 Tax=Granulicella pectinivorans TaxID=474950 RepID=A0A1I6M349_9BACT|nr:TIGR03435 family protein [Granulicella pectinivorans]SFS10068.1 soil-associated protein, TIGR03435 family [Granulicella pectinivorans]
MRRFVFAGLMMVCGVARGQNAPSVFDVATVKLVDPGPRASRILKMDGTKHFVAQNFTVKLLIAAAYDLNAKEISGGPAWMESEHYNIEARTPGETRPGRPEQMAMLRGLLVDRFGLKFHREPKVMSMYLLTVAPGGPKLKTSASAPDAQPQTISTVYPQKIVMPARNASMGDFVAVMQRAILDRPVVDKTGLTGRYDFDLEWAPDETQFGGEIPAAKEDAPSPPLFVAVREQMGLKLEATKGPVDAFVVDGVARPSAD